MARERDGWAEQRGVGSLVDQLRSHQREGSVFTASVNWSRTCIRIQRDKCSSLHAAAQLAISTTYSAILSSAKRLPLEREGPTSHVHPSNDHQHRFCGQATAKTCRVQM